MATYNTFTNSTPDFPKLDFDGIHNMLKEIGPLPKVEAPHGFQIIESPWLPKTMKDKDGIEREVVAVLMPCRTTADPFDLEPRQVSFMLGEPIADKADCV